MPLTRDSRGAATLDGLPLDTLFDAGGRDRPGAAGDAGGAARAAFQTPAYVYDLDAIEAEARALAAGFGGTRHLVAYAVKANTAGPILRALREAGCGAEAVSGGELAAVLAAGFTPDCALYSGVAKLDREIDQAIGAGDRGILAVQMESVEEIARVAARARALGRRARVSLRVNPSVEADTHAGVATGHDEAKFGIPRDDLEHAWKALAAAPELALVGLSCHIGSQLTRVDEYGAAAEVLLGIAAAREAAHGPLDFIDFGGGFGVDYGSGCPSAPADFVRKVTSMVAGSPLAGRTLVVEPGRSLVAAHGVLCASVIMAKWTRHAASPRRWLMIDAGMNDLVRPAMYGARHRIEPMDRAPAAESGGAAPYRVVGPVCESSDDFGEHLFAEPLPARVIVRDAGAYGFTMACEYNGRALPTEIFLRGSRVAAVIEPRGVEAWVAERMKT
jgi:diaminopimelate decarboxylase